MFPATSLGSRSGRTTCLSLHLLQFHLIRFHSYETTLDLALAIHFTWPLLICKETLVLTGISFIFLLCH